MILRCNGQCSILSEKFRKAKIKFCDAGVDANADAKMPMSKFPNGFSNNTTIRDKLFLK